MSIEEDVSLWGKAVGVAIGTTTLIGTLLSVGKNWITKDLKWRVEALEGQMDEMKAVMLSMQKEMTVHTREISEASKQVAVSAANMETRCVQFESDVDRVVEAIGQKVDHLERLGD